MTEEEKKIENVSEEKKLEPHALVVEITLPAPEQGFPVVDKVPIVEERRINLEAFKTGDCTACVFTKTCHYVDRVQEKKMTCPMLGGVKVKPASTAQYAPGIREARKRWVGMQRLGIKVVN